MLLTWAGGCFTPQWGCFNPAHKQGGGDVSQADGGRWGALLGRETIISEAGMLAQGMPRPPRGLGLALGWLDKWLVVDPRSNTTVVAMGQTFGASRLCGEHYSCNGVVEDCKLGHQHVRVA